MCRFLIVKSKTQINPVDLLNQFALVCEKSIAPDGEKQKDGFGIAWQENNKWKIKKSLSPIWIGQNVFQEIPTTKLLVVHARGSGFEKDRGNIHFNEPFINGDLCFVFNGIIRGVKIKRNLEGKIGSQKLFSLVKEVIKEEKQEVLSEINKLMLENSGKIEGMNIGIVKEGKISVLCQYSENKDYYSLYSFQDRNITIISSETFGNYRWKMFKKGEIKIF